MEVTTWAGLTTILNVIVGVINVMKIVLFRDPIKWFNTTKFLYLSQARIWISNIMSSKISLVKEQLVQVSTNLKLIQNIDLFKKKYTDYLKSKQNNEWLWHYIHYTQIVIFCFEDVYIVWKYVCCI
jgi:hypothetical protein